LVAEDGTCPLNAVELYLLIAAAYLHDIGMVVSDTEKLAILRSTEWASFVALGGAGHERKEAIEALRASEQPTHLEAHFLADLQLRFLLAEHVRRTHHIRTTELLTTHPVAFSRYDLGDPLVHRTIGALCAGHGLTPRDLEDDDDYPPRQRPLPRNAVETRRPA
jgi:hypothetical protein